MSGKPRSCQSSSTAAHKSCPEPLTLTLSWKLQVHVPDPSVLLRLQKRGEKSLQTASTRAVSLTLALALAPMTSGKTLGHLLKCCCSDTAILAHATASQCCSACFFLRVCSAGSTPSNSSCVCSASCCCGCQGGRDRETES